MSLTIAIVGAGYSGLALAAELSLLATKKLQIYLIDPATSVGLGIAYATDNPLHLLNVRAKEMSALASEPLHFVQWLNDRGLENPADAFLPRVSYGLYLQHLFDHLRQTPNKKVAVTHMQQQAIELELTASGLLELRLANQEILTVNKLVLASGHLKPTLPFKTDKTINLINNPWDYTRYKAIDKKAPIALIGTGLTMIDALFSLKAEEHQAPIHLISRRGLLPQSHGPASNKPPLKLDKLPPTLRGLMRYWQQAIKQGVDWQDLVQAIRPKTAERWSAFSLVEKKRFLRHLAPYWDSHRHRIAPEVATYLQRLMDSKKLILLAGKIFAANNHYLTIRPRYQEKIIRIQSSWLINCTGPSTYHLAHNGNPLIDNLLHQRLVALDELALGLKVNTQGALINEQGEASALLFALGPPCKGCFWESTAVPDIRQYSQALARLLLA